MSSILSKALGSIPRGMNSRETSSRFTPSTLADIFSLQRTIPCFVRINRDDSSSFAALTLSEETVTVGERELEVLGSGQRNTDAPPPAFLHPSCSRIYISQALLTQSASVSSSPCGQATSIHQDKEASIRRHRKYLQRLPGSCASSCSWNQGGIEKRGTFRLQHLRFQHSSNVASGNVVMKPRP